MRLDSLDKAPVVTVTDGLAEDFQKAAPPGASEVKAPSEPATGNTHQGEQHQGRLAKILNLIDEAQKRKQGQARQVREFHDRERAIATYSRVAFGFSDQTLGESLDWKG